MTDTEFQKQLLIQKIEAHRTLLRLEIESARAKFDPLGSALGCIGVDRQLTAAIVPAVRALTAGVAGHSALLKIGPLVSLAAILLTVLLGIGRQRAAGRSR